MITRKLSTRVLAAVAGLLAAPMVVTAEARAIPIGPDPYTPIPMMGWCPGGGFATGFGAYCDGMRFPDGSYWHQSRILGFWRMQCAVDNGTAIPDDAPVTGCGRVMYTNPNTNRNTGGVIA